MAWIFHGYAWRLHARTRRKILDAIVEEGECAVYAYDPKGNHACSVKWGAKKRGNVVHVCRVVARVSRGHESAGSGVFRHPLAPVHCVGKQAHAGRVCVNPNHVLLEEDERVPEPEPQGKRAEPEAERSYAPRMPPRKRRKARATHYEMIRDSRKRRLAESILHDVSPYEGVTKRNTAHNLAPVSALEALQDHRYFDTNMARVIAPPLRILGKSPSEERRIIDDMRIRSSTFHNMSPARTLRTFPPIYSAILAFTEGQLAGMQQQLDLAGFHPSPAEVNQFIIDCREDLVAERLPSNTDFPNMDVVVQDVEVPYDPSMPRHELSDILVDYPLGGRETWQRIRAQVGVKDPSTPKRVFFTGVPEVDVYREPLVKHKKARSRRGILAYYYEHGEMYPGEKAARGGPKPN